jgi:hypothetical protein
MPDLEKELKACPRDARRLDGLHARFWKDIMQPQVANFWSNVDAIHEATQKQLMTLCQLVQATPNNLDAREAYCHGLLTAKGDAKAYIKGFAKVQRLARGEVCQEDIASATTTSFLPDIHHLCGDSAHGSAHGQG